MNSEPVSITRRAVLATGIKGAAVASLVVPLMAEPEAAAAVPVPEFVPENDYPFFGGELPAAYSHSVAKDQRTARRV